MVKVSVFTPTHNTKYLDRAKSSLENQTFQDFEWVVVPNNLAEISEDIEGWEKTKVFPYQGGTSNIGEIKHFSAKHCCKGDIVVELDHDDELTPLALERIYEEFNKDKSLDFVYSNSVEMLQNGKTKIYDRQFGWKYRPCLWKSKVCYQCVSFPPTPASLCKIWTAPNHVRAWRKSFYDKIGGHNPYLTVLDDQELVCETYIHGKVKHIDECLYIYHIHENNSCFDDKLNAKIQSDTFLIHDRYIDGLVEKWCKLNDLTMVDLRGDEDKDSPSGYESLDIKDPMIANGEWPFETGKVGVFRAMNALCYLDNPVATMKKIYEYLAPEGWLLSDTPSTDGRGAFSNPCYKSYWNSNSFWHYTDPFWAEKIGTPAKFLASRILDYTPTEWHELNKITHVRADLCKFTSTTPGGVKWPRN